MKTETFYLTQLAKYSSFCEVKKDRKICCKKFCRVMLNIALKFLI